MLRHVRENLVGLHSAAAPSDKHYSVERLRKPKEKLTVDRKGEAGKTIILDDSALYTVISWSYLSIYLYVNSLTRKLTPTHTPAIMLPLLLTITHPVGIYR